MLAVWADPDKILDLAHARDHRTGLTITVGILQACLCQSDVEAFSLQNPVAIAAVGLVGQAKTASIIDGLVCF